MITDKINGANKNAIKLSDYYFELPPRLIAQNPPERRDDSRLMILERKNRSIGHKKFYDIAEYLRGGDVLVVNESKVIPARLLGFKEDTGAAAEFLLLERVEYNGEVGGDVWEVMMKPGRKGKKHTFFVFGDESRKLRAEILDSAEGGNKIVKFYYDGIFYEILGGIGKTPLPPYIKDCPLDESEIKERYQTVYANEKGSAAAPTAGLHFTLDLLEKLKSKGVVIAPVTLHVGLGTFRPVKTEYIGEHKMHEEYYYISEDSANKINAARQEGGRIIAVGTTSCRTLEACYKKHGTVKAGGDSTDIFIYGDYKFGVTDALITNFHLPESTLLMLVSAFYSKEEVFRAYNSAIENGYRFFSFGDAMFII